MQVVQGRDGEEIGQIVIADHRGNKDEHGCIGQQYQKKEGGKAGSRSTAESISRRTERWPMDSAILTSRSQTRSEVKKFRYSSLPMMK